MLVSVFFRSILYFAVPPSFCIHTMYSLCMAFLQNKGLNSLDGSLNIMVLVWLKGLYIKKGTEDVQ